MTDQRTPPDLAEVAVLGFGTMGAGIAQVVAASGRTVTVLEVDEQRYAAGRDALDRFLAEGVRRERVSEEQRTQVLERVRGVTDVGGLAGADLVIEAVSERREVKRDLLAAVADVVAPDALLATNTSALSVTDLAAVVRDATRVAGLHFFNPVPLMRVVEVVRALQTAEAVVERLAAFVTSLGHEPVVVKDRPGFLVNSLLIPYLNDVIAEYDADLASADDIDTAMRLGLGYRQGPLELLDRLGLDVHLDASRSAYEATQDPRYAPPPLLRAMVAAGRLGTKSGHGFRTGPDDGPDEQ